MVSDGFVFPAWSRWVLGAGLFVGWMVLAFVFLVVEVAFGMRGWSLLMWGGVFFVSGYVAIRCAGRAEEELLEGVADREESKLDLDRELERLRRDKRLAVEFVEELPGLLDERGFMDAADLVRHEVDGGREAYYLGRGESE